MCPSLIDLHLIKSEWSYLFVLIISEVSNLVPLTVNWYSLKSDSLGLSNGVHSVHTLVAFAKNPVPVPGVYELQARQR